MLMIFYRSHTCIHTDHYLAIAWVILPITMKPFYNFFHDDGDDDDNDDGDNWLV